MYYYMRLLTESDGDVAVTELQRHLEENDLSATFELTRGIDDEWEELHVYAKSAQKIFILKKLPVTPHSEGNNQIQQLLNELGYYYPESSEHWLNKYLPRVKTVFLFEVLNAIDDIPNGWDIRMAISEKLWNELDGILQADNEGFTNIDGFHILWQFDEDVDGEWFMGVIQNREWVHFKMDLEDEEQRESFLQGEVPPGIEIIEKVPVEEFYFTQD